MADFFSEIIQKLTTANIENPRLEARFLCAEILHKSPSEITSGETFDETQKQAVLALLEKRLAHCPLDKVLGHCNFYKSEFITNTNVLSPRPDTEILVEEAIMLIKNNKASSVLDLGTGSGCIIISLLNEFSDIKGTAVDISSEALKTANLNAVKNQVAERLTFINKSWFDDDFTATLKNKFDIITSNPPYIPSDDIKTLEPEVKNFDPMLALDGGTDGFDSYKRLAELAPELLNDNGYILLEAGINQARDIADIFKKNGLSLYAVVPDLAGIERCIILQKTVAKNKNI